VFRKEYIRTNSYRVLTSALRIIRIKYHAMKMHGGNKRIYPHVGLLNLFARRMQGPRLPLWPPCLHVKLFRYQLNVRLCVSQDGYRCNDEPKMSLTLKKTLLLSFAITLMSYPDPSSLRRRIL